MFPLLTGQDATDYRRDVSGAQGWDFDTLRADLADGGHLVASTPVVAVGGEDPQVAVTRHDPSGELVADTVSIKGPHSYTVVDVETDGSVWLINPWGEGNPADGGGSFRVSTQDFDRLFHDVASSGGVG